MKNKYIVIIVLILVLITYSFVPCSSKEKLDVVYFYSSRCLACKENEHFIDDLSKVDGINLIKYNTDEADCSNIQAAYAKQFGVKDEKSLIVPYIYYGTKSYELSPSVYNIILGEIDDYVSGKVPYKNFEYNAGSCITSPYEQLAKNITIPSILIAGLIDGINPCAISILMVFYSFLLMTEDKLKIVKMSSMFIIGMFIANVSFGMGFELFYNMIAGNQLVLYLLYGSSILMCLIAFVINTIDILNHRKEIVKNQLPDTIKYKMINLLRKSTFSRFATISSLFVGFIIGSVELACTGQIYFPTLTYMIQVTNYGFESIILLLIYNLMFILPLIIVTVIAALIKKPECVKNAIMRKNWIIKTISNIFFVIMIVILTKQILII